MDEHRDHVLPTWRTTAQPWEEGHPAIGDNVDGPHGCQSERQRLCDYLYVGCLRLHTCVKTRRVAAKAGEGLQPTRRLLHGDEKSWDQMEDIVMGSRPPNPTPGNDRFYLLRVFPQHRPVALGPGRSTWPPAGKGGPESSLPVARRVASGILEPLNLQGPLLVSVLNERSEHMPAPWL